MKKRIWTAILAAVMMLTACGNIPGLNELRRAGNGSEEREETAGESKDERKTFGGEQSQEAPKETEAEEGDYEKGNVSDTGWESEYWNLRYTAPEGMLMVSEEGLAITMGLGAELMEKSYSERQMEYIKMTTLYEMMSMDAQNTVNVLGTVEKLLVRSMPAETYKAAFLAQLTNVTEPVYTILDDSGTAEIGGETYLVVSTMAEYAQNSAYQDYYIRTKGDRAFALIITYSEDTKEMAETVLNSFEAY